MYSSFVRFVIRPTSKTNSNKKPPIIGGSFYYVSHYKCYNLKQTRHRRARRGNNNAELFKDPEMLERFKDISEFNKEDRKYILYTIDALIKNVKLKAIA